MTAAAPPAPRALLWDWDLTLVDNWLAVTAAFNQVRLAFGLAPWSLDDSRAELRHSQRETFPRLFGDQAQLARDQFYAAYERGHCEHLLPMPGAEALLADLVRRGLPMAIVSNKTGRFLRAELAHLGWSARFGAAIGALDASADKPDPAPALLALERLGIAPGPEVWFAGDADVDIACARAAGLTPFLVHADAARAGAPMGSFHQVPDLDALADCLARAFST